VRYLLPRTDRRTEAVDGGNNGESDTGGDQIRWQSPPIHPSKIAKIKVAPVTSWFRHPEASLQGFQHPTCPSKAKIERRSPVTKQFISIFML
jgi:hypothetical protein